MSGASKLYIEDIVDDFCDNYIVPCVQAHAVYENKYLIGTAMARPAITKRSLRSQGRRPLSPSVTVLQEKEMTRSASSWPSKLWLRTSRSSRPGG